MTRLIFPNPDPIGDFEKKVRSKKNKPNEYFKEKKTKSLKTKNLKSNTRPKYKASGGRITLKNGGKVARGCGVVMSDRRKKTKYF